MDFRYFYLDTIYQLLDTILYNVKNHGARLSKWVKWGIK